MDYAEWTTSGDGNWTFTTERAASGIYSVRSPDLSNEDRVPAESNLTFTTNPNWEAGIMHFSLLGGVQLPFDSIDYYVDGVPRGGGEGVISTDFADRTLILGPGLHVVTFVYRYNPTNVESANFPLEGGYPDRIGATFIDDVYFIPDGPGPSISPTPVPAPTTIAPTVIPEGVVYYNSFEKGSLDQYAEWTTAGDNGDEWFVTDEQAASGVFSLRSPALEPNATSSSVTFATNQDWGAGMFRGKLNSNC